MVIIYQNKLEETMFSKMYVRICPPFWYQMAISGVLAQLFSWHMLVFSAGNQGVTDFFWKTCKIITWFQSAITLESFPDKFNQIIATAME